MNHEAILYRQISDPKKPKLMQCMLCAHYCLIEDGEWGKCLVRRNNGGTLYTSSWGMAQGFAMDPIEKKPFFHFKPGSKVLSFGTPGCNFQCANCQNWQMSQSLRLSQTLSDEELRITPEDLARLAVEHGADGIAYTYSEPTIFFEYVYDTIKACNKNPGTSNLFHVLISNGFFSDELIDLLINENLVDAVNIDLKFMRPDKYRKICGAELKPGLNSIRRIAEAGIIHLEVINLVIPGENDTLVDFRKLAEFISSVSVDIPLHFSRFFPRYRMQDKSATPVEKLIEARKVSLDAGIKYVYIGNSSLPGSQDTHCSKCRKVLITREGYSSKIDKDFKLKGLGFCPVCNEKIHIVF